MESLKISAGDWFLSFFKDFVGTPAILVGLFSMLGAILLRKKTTEIITTFFKTVAGFLILSGGAGVLVGALSNFQILFEDLFGLTGSIPNNEGVAGVLLERYTQIAQLGSIIMVLSILMNISLAYFSRFKYIYLSGHVLFYMSIAVAAVMVLSGFNLENPGDYSIALISSSMIISLYMVLSCALLHRWTKIITKTNDISVAHTGALSYAMGGIIGDIVYKIKSGKNIKYTEQIKFPKWLQFFRNTFISMSITMLIVFFVIYIPEGIMYSTGIKKLEVIENGQLSEQAKKIKEIFGKDAVNWLIRAIVEAFTFAAGVEIILFGVRMVIGELVPSFKGISDKLIKNAKAGIDCPVVFPYAPNAVLIGFVCSLIGSLIGLGVSISISSVEKALPVIIPGIVAQFFLGATTAVFANARGGLIAAIIASFLNGIIITLIPIVFYLTNSIPKDNDKFINSVWGDTDYAITLIPKLLVLPGGSMARILAIGIPGAFWLGLTLDGVLHSQVKKNKNTF